MSQESTLTESPQNEQAQPVNIIKLVSCTDSTIESVSVYSNRAEITRRFTHGIKLKEGRNRVNISGLPKVIIPDSVRVEVRSGAATIHDATVTFDPPERISSPETSNILKELSDKKKSAEKACERAKKSLLPLETYLEHLKIEHLDTSTLSEAVKSYGSITKELDDTIARLENELIEINKAIKEEKEKEKEKENSAVVDPKVKRNLLLAKASIGVVGDSDGEVEITLIYAVAKASWQAAYDIHVNTRTKDEPPVKLTYRSGITQNTGEDWDNVRLKVQTVNPTSRLGLPTLTPLNISTHRQSQGAKRPSPIYSDSSRALRQPRSRAIRPILPNPNESSNRPSTQKRHLDVSPQNNLNSPFKEVNSISIPSDAIGILHNVTIDNNVSLDAKISGLCVPKKDTKTYLNARIINGSRYPFLSGKANVYVDGDFISKSDVPFVTTGEGFDCLLRVDPFIKVTYHPRSKKVSSSGFFNRTTNYLFSQRITVSNTGTSKIEKLKIVDQIHTSVSEDSDATVELVSPALKLPGQFLGNVAGELKALEVPEAKVDQEIIAKWDGSGETEVEALGLDGKLYWECNIPARKRIGLLLEWRVKVPLGTDVVGLNFF